MVLAVIIFADSGYQGILKYHAWSLIPIKKSKKKELSEAEKAFNKELSRRRIVIENINAHIKGVQDNVLSLPESPTQTPVANETRLCDTQRRKSMKRVRQQV